MGKYFGAPPPGWSMEKEVSAVEEGLEARADLFKNKRFLEKVEREVMRARRKVEKFVPDEQEQSEIFEAESIRQEHLGNNSFSDKKNCPIYYPVYRIPDDNQMNLGFVQLFFKQTPRTQDKLKMGLYSVNLFDKDKNLVKTIDAYRTSTPIFILPEDGVAANLAFYLPGNSLVGKEVFGLGTADPFSTYFDSLIKVIAKYYPEGGENFWVQPERWPVMPKGGQVLVAEKDPQFYLEMFSKFKELNFDGIPDPGNGIVNALIGKGVNVKVTEDEEPISLQETEKAYWRNFYDSMGVE